MSDNSYADWLKKNGYDENGNPVRAVADADKPQPKKPQPKKEPKLTIETTAERVRRYLGKPKVHSNGK